jgi:hypothetical protein
LSFQVAGGNFLPLASCSLKRKESNMAKFVITDSYNGEEEETARLNVDSFAEATWFLAKDLHDTAEKKWGTEVLQEWQELWRDSPAGSPIEVKKGNGNEDSIFTFRYDPS